MALSTGQLVGATWAVRGQPQQTLVSRWVPRGVYVMERGVVSFIEHPPPPHTHNCVGAGYIYFQPLVLKFMMSSLLLLCTRTFSTRAKVFYFPPLLLVLYCFKPKGGLLAAIEPSLLLYFSSPGKSFQNAIDPSRVESLVAVGKRKWTASGRGCRSFPVESYESLP